MDSSSNWRYTTHLANMPIHYEFKDENEDDTDAIKGTYLPQYKQIFDLYLTDSTCDPLRSPRRPATTPSTSSSTGSSPTTRPPRPLPRTWA